MDPSEANQLFTGIESNRDLSGKPTSSIISLDERETESLHYFDRGIVGPLHERWAQGVFHLMASGDRSRPIPITVLFLSP